jgi:hypothetical protein
MKASAFVTGPLARPIRFTFRFFDDNRRQNGSGDPAAADCCLSDGAGEPLRRAPHTYRNPSVTPVPLRNPRAQAQKGGPVEHGRLFDGGAQTALLPKELDINKRFAGKLYVGLRRVTDAGGTLQLDGSGGNGGLARRDAPGSMTGRSSTPWWMRGTITASDVERTADAIAQMHRGAPSCGALIEATQRHALVRQLEYDVLVERCDPSLRADVALLGRKMHRQEILRRRAAYRTREAVLSGLRASLTHGDLFTYSNICVLERIASRRPLRRQRVLRRDRRRHRVL